MSGTARLEASAFGAQLRSYRERAGLTQEELAERAGLTADGISALERGVRRRPYPHTVRALAEALGLSQDQRSALLETVSRTGRKRPGSTPPSGGTWPTDPPASLTPLIGREREVAEVCALVRRPGVRLLTLTGPGGVGKTRLALAAAHESHDAFADGVVFIALAAVHDPALVAATIATAVDIPALGGRSAIDALKAHLRHRELLLVLDNFEQIVPAAPLITDLLTACPGVKALVTSRARLLVTGERDFPVSPLPLPDPADPLSPEHLRSWPATRLFLERAEAINPRYTALNGDAAAVAEICVRLDGIPLAIELAAARANVLQPAALLARLEPCLPLLTSGPRDLPARLRTMRDAIAWSYDLLAGEERALFRRLSVFVGGFTLAAAERVSGQEGPATTGLRPEVLDGIASLVDKSLLRQTDGPDDEPRFRMLETIREYGLEQLERSGEAEEARRRHAAWYLDLAERAELELQGPGLLVWLLRLEAEHANLRAALDWLRTHAATEDALRLGGSLADFWWYRGHFSEGMAQLERLLAMPGARHYAGPWARAMTGLGALLYKGLGESERAVQLHEQAVAVWRERGDQARLGYALWCLGLALGGTDSARAESVLTESLAIARPTGIPWLIGPNLWALARTVRDLGEPERAATILEETRALLLTVDHPLGVPLTLAVLGDVVLDLGETDRAAGLLAQALAYLQNVSARWGTAGGRRGLVAVAAAPWGTFGCLESLAAVAMAREEPARAARLFGAAAALREAVGLPREPIDQRPYQRRVAQVRAALREAQFTAAWAEGQTMTLEDAVAEALTVADNPVIAAVG